MLKSFGLAASVLFVAGGIAVAAQPSSLATSDHWLMSDIYGAGVYDPSNSKIGKVDDLVLSPTGQIKMAVIGVGGFLGVGEKDVAIPFTDLKITNFKGTEELTLNRTKDQLKSAPAYKKTTQVD